MEYAMERSFSFTAHAEKVMLNTIEDLSFPSRDVSMIFQALQSRLEFIPFCDYLKRHIYLKSGMIAPFRSVPLSVYQDTMLEAFRDSGTPASLRRGSSHLATRVHDWLVQESVHRDGMLLIGFGLSMSLEDVNTFLTCACHDHTLDPEDPLEAVCAYCYEHGYGFAKMEQLMDLYRRAAEGEDIPSLVQSAHPAGRSASKRIVREDTALLHRLAARMRDAAPTSVRQHTRSCFRSLYASACKAVQAQHPEEFASPEDIRPHDLENILCAPIPRTRHGNLIPHLNSSLHAELSRNRLSRQRLHRLLTGDVEPTRYDLITLNFLIHALEPSSSAAQQKDRYLSYLSETNDLLESCAFGPLYPTDPYECFLLMCMVSANPLDTFSDIQEISYTDPAGGDLLV